jgi:quercetin 2,3-dioxygenase
VPRKRWPEAVDSIRVATHLIRGRATSDGAGVRLTRIIDGSAAAAGGPDFDPFLLLDEFGSDRPGDYIAGFPDHPHRGFETVTYMLAGRMRHRDNAGNSGLLVPGGVQWMTAGRGLVHSEMPEQQDGLLRGFQLWINLPARDKLTAPRYQDIEPQRIPEIEPSPGVRLRVLAGRLAGVEGPVQTGATAATWLDLRLAPGATFDAPCAPPTHTMFVYVHEGAAGIGVPDAEQSVPRGVLALLGAGARLRLRADAAGCQAICVAGARLGEPVARYGPFVMNTAEEIQQAIADYRAGRL